MPLTAHFLYCKQKFLDWMWGYDSWPNATQTRAARGVETIKISKIKKVLEISRLQRPTQFINQKMWCHQESNRGHKDFQSFALPTELWHHFSIASAKVVINYLTGKFWGTFLYYFLFICTLFRFLQYLCTAFKRRKPVAKAILRFAIGIRFWHRDVAQLVAHYVRDVGVGRSSRLIPTKSNRPRIGSPMSWPIDFGVCFYAYLHAL